MNQLSDGAEASDISSVGSSDHHPAKAGANESALEPDFSSQSTPTFLGNRTRRFAQPGPTVPPELLGHPRYEIHDVLGFGGMGAVYKARHRLMDRVVALKVINPALVKYAEMVARFRREMRAAARLHHPNIVTAHDADQAGETHFLVMEFVDGCNLGEMLKGRARLPPELARGYAGQAAQGLQHAFERGMVHRDIKPHNLMVTADGVVKILDLGSLASPVKQVLRATSSKHAMTTRGPIRTQRAWAAVPRRPG